MQLQGAQINVVEGLKRINVMTTSLQTARDLTDGYHSLWFKNASKIGNDIDAAIKAPTICKRQTFKGNVGADDVETYFKQNVAITFLHRLLSQLSRRFSNESCFELNGMTIVPAVMQTEYTLPVSIG